jgi:hypothetical protein
VLLSLLEEAPPELELGEALELLGGVLDEELLEGVLDGELELLGEALDPPEADPDLLLSVEELDELGEVAEGVDELLGEDELLDEELGVLGELDAPPVPPTEAEPELEPGVLGLVGDEAVLELEEPGVEEVFALSSRLHAARPKATATAIARAESFMCPPWLG